MPISYEPDNQDNRMFMEPNTAAKSLAEETKAHRALYPEVYMKLKPLVSVTCDKINSSGVIPNQKELEDIADGIYDDFCKMHPDMENYMKKHDMDNDMPDAVQTIDYYDGYRHDRRFGGFRRRGLARDLIVSLLLAELFGMRRSYPYPISPYY